MRDHRFQQQQQDRGQSKAEQWRKQQRFADFLGLAPIDARSAAAAVQQRIGDADADDRADKVCELDAGKPNAQVPRFQMIAAINSAKTIANPALLPTWRISSTGSSEIMPKATAPLDASTPKRLNIPDQMTAKFAGSERV